MTFNKPVIPNRSKLLLLLLLLLLPPLVEPPPLPVKPLRVELPVIPPLLPDPPVLVAEDAGGGTDGGGVGVVATADKEDDVDVIMDDADEVGVPEDRVP